MKIVIRSIPTDISEAYFSDQFTGHEFDVKIVKRFGETTKPLPICLMILAKNTKSIHIFKLRSLFYLKVKAETFKKSGPAQYYLYQIFGLELNNCGHLSRCVKGSGKISAKECPNTLELHSTSCNCGESYMANYKYYLYEKPSLKTSTI